MNNIKKITAILPMRSGSQRVKGKNVRLLNKKHLYEYIITTLLKSKLISNIIINTDIKGIQNKYYENSNIEFVERPDYLKGNINMNLVIQQTLDHTKDKYFIQVHATSPLLNENTIDEAINFYLNNQMYHDSLFSVTKIQKRFWKKDGIPINHNLSDDPTTQNLNPYYEENSSFYIFSRESFKNNNNRIGKRPFLYEISKIESWDIDEEEDFEIVKYIIENNSIN